MSFSLKSVCDFDLPDTGDLTKDLAMACGLDEETANIVAAGGCVLTGDIYGGIEHGLDVAEDQGLTFEARVEHGGTHGTPTSIEAWMAWFDRDPEAAFDAYYTAMANGTLPDEMKSQEVMMALQYKLQEYNRQCTALSSLQQALHETKKEACRFSV